MRKRIGIILCLTGIMLLVKPNFNLEQIMMQVNYIIANYWPLALVILGLLLVWPQSKSIKKTRRRA